MKRDLILTITTRDGEELVNASLEVDYKATELTIIEGGVRLEKENTVAELDISLLGATEL